MAVQLDGIFDDEDPFVQEDNIDEDEEDDIDNKIEEEHSAYKKAQLQRQAELHASRGWSAPTMSSPGPGSQRQRAEEDAQLAEASAEAVSMPRATFMPPHRTSTSRGHAHLQPARPASAGSALRRQSPSASVLEGIEEEQGTGGSTIPSRASSLGHRNTSTVAKPTDDGAAGGASFPLEATSMEADDDEVLLGDEPTADDDRVLGEGSQAEQGLGATTSLLDEPNLDQPAWDEPASTDPAAEMWQPSEPMSIPTAYSAGGDEDRDQPSGLPVAGNDEDPVAVAAETDFEVTANLAESGSAPDPWAMQDAPIPPSQPVPATNLEESMNSRAGFKFSAPSWVVHGSEDQEASAAASATSTPRSREPPPFPATLFEEEEQTDLEEAVPTPSASSVPEPVEPPAPVPNPVVVSMALPVHSIPTSPESVQRPSSPPLDELLAPPSPSHVHIAPSGDLALPHEYAVQLMDRDLYALPAQAAAVVKIRPWSGRTSLAYHGILGIHVPAPIGAAGRTSPGRSSPPLRSPSPPLRLPSPPALGGLSSYSAQPEATDPTLTARRRPLSAPAVKRTASRTGARVARVYSAHASRRSPMPTTFLGVPRFGEGAGAAPESSSKASSALPEESVASLTLMPGRPSNGQLQPVLESEDAGSGPPGDKMPWPEWHKLFSEANEENPKALSSTSSQAAASATNTRPQPGTRTRPWSARPVSHTTPPESGLGGGRARRPMSAREAGDRAVWGMAPLVNPGMAGSPPAANAHPGPGSTFSEAAPVASTAAVNVDGRLVSVYIADTAKRIVDANRMLTQMGSWKRYKLAVKSSTIEIEVCDSMDGSVQSKLALAQFLGVYAKLKSSASRRPASAEHVGYHGGGGATGEYNPTSVYGKNRSKPVTTAVGQGYPYSITSFRRITGESARRQSSESHEDDMSRAGPGMDGVDMELLASRITAVAHKCHSNASEVKGLRHGAWA